MNFLQKSTWTITLVFWPKTLKFTSKRVFRPHHLKEKVDGEPKLEKTEACLDILIKADVVKEETYKDSSEIYFLTELALSILKTDKEGFDFNDLAEAEREFDEYQNFTYKKKLHWIGREEKTLLFYGSKSGIETYQNKEKAKKQFRHAISQNKIPISHKNHQQDPKHSRRFNIPIK